MEKKKETTELRQFVDRLEVKDCIGHQNLTLVPLGGEGDKHLDYILASEALKVRSLTVTEVSDSGHVNELVAESTSDKMILMLDGEELVGAKQNRILNTTVLLAPKAKTRIPVSCVERGRWGFKTRSFTEGNYAPPVMRANKSRSVGRSLQQSGHAESDQGQVWHDIDLKMASLGVHSETIAMVDIVDQRRDKIDAFVNAIEYQKGIRGLIAAINGRFIAIDLFDKADTLASMWKRLVTGYAMDAIMQLKDKSALFTAKSGKFFLDCIGDCKPSKFPAVGIGEDWRFESPGILGQALVAEEACVHMSVFPNILDDRRHHDEVNYMPPSFRRTHRRSV